MEGWRNETACRRMGVWANPERQTPNRYRLEAYATLRPSPRQTGSFKTLS